MNYLLDTCVLSEFTRPEPDTGVVEWLDATPERHLFISVLTLGEIQYGISRLAPGKRKQSLQGWLDDELTTRFQGRILPVDDRTALRWGELRCLTAEQGLTLPVIDGLLASQAVLGSMTFVTRNVQDFEKVPGLQVANPWG